MRSLQLANLLAAAAPSLFRFDGVMSAPTVSLAGFTDERRTELLRRAVNRDHVALDLNILGYEQRPGVRNRKSVRFADKSLPAMAKSSVGRPFIRDHMQGDSTARSGTITSATATSSSGSAEIWMGVSLTEPAAVERALRELMGPVSIGVNPTGPINCTICDAEILSTSKCLLEFHLPGTETDDGVVEWEYTSSEIVELSECLVPAVAGAGIESIRDTLRASLSAAGFSTNPSAPASVTDGEMWKRISRIRRH